MSILVGIIFIITGIAIKHGKMYNLIAGYNSMSEEKKAQYDIEKIATLFRNVMFGMSGIIIVGFVISKWLSNPKIEFQTITLTVLIGITFLLIASNSKHYRKKK